MVRFVAVFFFFTGLAQAASLIQGAASAPDLSLHNFVDIFAPLNSFAAGVLWTRLAAMKEDIVQLQNLVIKPHRRD